MHGKIYSFMIIKILGSHLDFGHPLHKFKNFYSYKIQHNKEN